MPKKPLSDEDIALFRNHMRAVTPLKNNTPRIDQTPPKNEPPLLKHPKSERPDKTEEFLSDFISEPVLSESTLSYCSPGIPTKRFSDLKSGRIPWERQLDLHGLYAEHAKTKLIDFIHQCAQNGARCTLIIHGKGGHQGNPPVIKNLLNRWLPQMNTVLAFCSALAKDGGTGAVYVLLKKQKA